MQVDRSEGSPRVFFVEPIGVKQKVVRNKNTGQSFWVRGCNDGNVELVPIQGEDLLIPVGSFNAESWQVIH